eukprot:TRINITY_DN1353_c0_g1_i1.p1 TRINITY_DN1353_c0_g1~~TRINITY_DN1353_c0_g1_i1.p1  ORF type:complete len:439 (-),score=115.86 TRINITY_DN1353_c0_g1_i1:381-1697(-)
MLRGLGEQSLLKCSMHGKEFELFCVQCQSMICFKCMAVSHRLHECQGLDVAAMDAAIRLNLKMDEVKSIIGGYEDQLNKVQADLNIMRDARVQATSEVESFFQEAKALLEARQKALVDEIDKMCSEREEELSSVTEAIATAKRAAERDLNSAQDVLSSKSDAQIISGRECIDHVKKVEIKASPMQLRVLLHREKVVQALQNAGSVMNGLGVNAVVAVSREKSTVSGDGLRRVFTDRLGKFEVTLRDITGKVIDDESVPLTVQVSGDDEEAKERAESSVKHVGGGKYECAFRLPKDHEGIYSVAVKCWEVHLDSSPYQGEVVKLSKDKSSVTGNALTHLAKGATGQINIILKDTKGRAYDDPSAPVEVRVTSVETKVAMETSLCYLGDGAHRSTFGITGETSKYTVAVMCGRVKLAFSEGTVQVIGSRVISSSFFGGLW